MCRKANRLAVHKEDVKMLVKYTIKRKDLYDGYYYDTSQGIISGKTTDKLMLSPILPVLYRIIKRLRALEKGKGNGE